MAEPQIWGFTRPTADRLAAMAGQPVTLRPPQTQRSRQPRMIGGGGNGVLIKTPPGGIAAASGSGPYTFGAATCTIVNADGTLSAETRAVTNIVKQAIAGNVIGKASPVGDLWVLDVASCTS